MDAHFWASALPALKLGVWGDIVCLQVMVGSLSLGEAEDTQIHTHNCRDGGSEPRRNQLGGMEGVLFLRWEGRRGRLEIQPVEGTQPADTENTQMEKSKTFMEPHTHSAGMTGAGLERTSRLWPQSLATR